MCGIFGLVGPAYNERRRQQSARSLWHRGPDGFGEHEDPRNRVYLAHCRLAVIDLTDNGAQPMCNEDGSIWINYNGEIYDFDELRRDLEGRGHRFSSATDTEVILHAYEEWGIACLERLNGMFAFALWDSAHGKLFLVRDRFGIKPLYYGIFDETLAFASEPRALIDLPFVRKAIDPSALCSYLLYKYVAGPASIWQGISRLLPAHYLEYDLEIGSAAIRRYWELPLVERAFSAKEALEHFSGLFEESVRNCMVSDVPVGVFLSGGYDSSAVTRVATGRSPRINTFCIGFAGWENDERSAAAETARFLTTTHHEELLGVEHFAKIGQVMEAFDEPLADSSIFPTYLVSAAARRHVTVALSGDGGDELLGGYNWYQHMVDCSSRKRFAFLLEPVVRTLGLNRTAWGRRCSALDHYRLLTSPAFHFNEIRRLFPTLPHEAMPQEEASLYREHLKPELDGYRRWQYIDLQTFLCDSNLMKVDRAAMAHSLEVRVPFLDHRLAEFLFTLPGELLADAGEKKQLLARWLEQNDLAKVVKRRKQGFSCPVFSYWPAEKMAAELDNGRLVQSGLLDRHELRKCLKGRGVHPDLKLFILAVLEKWAQRWLT